MSVEVVWAFMISAVTAGAGTWVVVPAYFFIKRLLLAFVLNNRKLLDMPLKDENNFRKMVTLCVISFISIFTIEFTLFLYGG